LFGCEIPATHGDIVQNIVHVHGPPSAKFPPWLKPLVTPLGIRIMESKAKRTKFFPEQMPTI